MVLTRMVIMILMSILILNLTLILTQILMIILILDDLPGSLSCELKAIYMSLEVNID